MAISEKMRQLTPAMFITPLNPSNVLNCHNSTFLATLWDYSNMPPSLNDLLNVPGGTTNLIRHMLPYGTQLARPSFFGQAVLDPDSVVVFVKPDGGPGHSCVALDAHRICGFNQLGWFSRSVQDEQENVYTEHSTREIVWKFSGKTVKARSSEYTIVCVPAADARKVVKQSLVVSRSR